MAAIMTYHLSKSLAYHRFWAAIVMVLFAAFLNYSGSSAPVDTQPNQIVIPSSNSLPTTIITTDGQIYKHPKLLKVLADGLLVEYLPDSGGTGMARLKFKNLSESLQKQFGYDQKKAAAYEKDQALAMTEMAKRQAQTEKTRTAIKNELSRAIVYVDSASPTVSYTYYDPAGPKPPDLTDRAGCTKYEYKFNANYTIRNVRRGPDEPFNFHFDAVKVSLGLVITITLPNGEAGKLKQHEEGHRKIDEYFYTLAPQAAKRASETVSDDEMRAYEANPESATMTDISKIRFENFEAEYLKQTKGIGMQANSYYDELTDHGLNNMDSDQAAQMAISRYAQQP